MTDAAIPAPRSVRAAVEARLKSRSAAERRFRLYGQIAIEDLGSEDVPDWNTGEERAVASAQTILVATRSDAEGSVRLASMIRTWRRWLLPGGLDRC